MELNKALGYQFENIERALQYPSEVSQIIDGNWLMQRTGLPPGITLGKLKDWLFRIQIERGYSNEDDMEAVLCSIPWNLGNENEWPSVNWP